MQEMFNKVLWEGLLSDPLSPEFELQARRFIHLFRGSAERPKVLSHITLARDHAYGPKWFEHEYELTIEIAFAIGMQFGYQLGICYPPIKI